VRDRVMRLYKRGELKREGENWRNRTRYRYFRRTSQETADEREAVRA
jgi:hypothetical protein